MGNNVHQHVQPTVTPIRDPFCINNFVCPEYRRSTGRALCTSLPSSAWTTVPLSTIGQTQSTWARPEAWIARSRKVGRLGAYLGCTVESGRDLWCFGHAQVVNYCLVPSVLHAAFDRNSPYPTLVKGSAQKVPHISHARSTLSVWPTIASTRGLRCTRGSV